MHRKEVLYEAGFPGLYTQLSHMSAHPAATADIRGAGAAAPRGSKPSFQRLLKRAFRILIVESETAAADQARDFFRGKDIFALDMVAAAWDMEKRLDARAYHMCMLSLDVRNGHSDEFYLLCKYKDRLPVLAMSSKRSLSYGARCAACGAFRAMDKPIDFTCPDFVSALRTGVFRSVFGLASGSSGHPQYERAIGSLYGGSARSVDQWASEMGVTERRLRKICRSCPLAPRDMLRLSELVLLAMDCSLSGPGECEAGCDLAERCAGANEYFLSHMAGLLKFLRIDANALPAG